MPFANMTYEDRLAFFDLMDEYFAARPNLFSNGSSSSSSNGAAVSSMAGAAASSFARAHPEATQNAISAGIRNQAAANPQSKWSGALSNPKVSGALGKMGASHLAAGGGAPAPAASSAPPPPAPSSNLKQRAQGVSGLVSGRSFGHLDTSSKMGAMKTMFKDPQAAPAPYVPPPTNTTAAGSPPAFAKPKNNLPPPPTRRVAPSAPVAAAPEPEPEQEVDDGHYAEAVYDFSSNEAGDLPLKAKAVVLILEKVSDDWWKAMDPQSGREGLVPSAYLKEI